MKNSIQLLGIGIGALAGFLYWKFIGCSTGSCAITANPYMSTIYGALLGRLISSMFERSTKRTPQS